MRGQYVAENEGQIWPKNAYNFLIPPYQVRMTHLTAPKYISQKYEMKKNPVKCNGLVIYSET